MVKIILASQSPRRAELLKQIGIDFEIIPSKIKEEEMQGSDPVSYVKKLAKLKARSVAGQIGSGIVIGADTVVYVDRQILGKPKDREEATKMLRLLSGKVHKVIGGICVINKDSKQMVTKSVATKVKFRKLNGRLIDWYVGTGEPFDKAGGYGIQGKGAVLVEYVYGDYFNVVGLPLSTLAAILEKMKVL